MSQFLALEPVLPSTRQLFACPSKISVIIMTKIMLTHGIYLIKSRRRDCDREWNKISEYAGCTEFVDHLSVVLCSNAKPATNKLMYCSTPGQMWG